MAHTPGPWEVRGGMTPAFTVVTAGEQCIVWAMADYMVHTQRGNPLRAPSHDDQRANARLIAAAPDLLAACKAVLEQLNYLQGLWGKEGVTNTLTEKVAAAVAKAEATP